MPEITLPAFPLSAARAAGLFRIPDPTLEDVLPIVEHDPAFTAAVLRAANSAASASLREVRTPKVAVMRIGARHTRRLVLGMAVSRAFTDLGRSGLDTDALWLHLCTVASVADRLTFSQAQQGEAFTAGILHDIGRLAMASQDPARYSAVVYAGRHGRDVEDTERATFGIDHATWGGVIAHEWGFPDDLAAAIGDHHEGTSSGLGWALATARRIAILMGLGDGILESIGDDPFDTDDASMLAGIGGADVLLHEARSMQEALRAA